MKLIKTALILCTSLLFAQQSQQILFDSKDIPKGCYRIPSMIKAPNGNLIAVVDERIFGCGDLIYNRDINIVARRSTDNGKTWGEVERFIDFPEGQSASDASMVVDEKTKEIFLFYNYMDLDKAKGEFRLHVAKSSDNGNTWSNPVDITESISTPEQKMDFKFITSGRGFYSKDGKILNTLVSLKYGVFLFGSDDHGKTWKVMSDALHPADESLVTEVKDGYLVNSRVRNLGKRREYIVSRDGKTIRAENNPNLTDPTCNASILKTKNNYYFSNLNHPTNRENLSIRHSKDGLKWSEPLVVYKGASAYSSLVELSKNQLGILFEKDGYKQVAFDTIDKKQLHKMPVD